MPGLTLVWRHPDAGAHGAPQIDVAGASHTRDDETRVLHAGARTWLASTAYRDYPVTVHEWGPVLAVVEGRFYGPAPIEELSRAMLAHTVDPARLERWLASVDGDFVLAVVDRAGDRAALLNDRYGRLPLYVGRAGDRLVASRHLPLVAKACAGRRLDHAAVAQFLVFGYPLGDATLHEGVTRLPPAILLRDAEPAVQVVATPRFDAKTDVADVAKALAGALVDACRARAAGGGPSVVTMSGGIDSRMAAAALRRAGVEARAVTHSDVHGVAARDVRLAREVSERLGMPWTLIRLDPPTGREMAALLRMKSGANYLGMSYVLPFFARLAEEHGRRAVLFTGDGGDKVLVDQRPVVRLRDEPALVEYLLRREAILPAETVARIVGVDRAAIAEGVRRRVASYPEDTPDQRYVHFMFAERARKFLFEGEDRNRHYLWSVTPFYAPAVFEAAMAVPDDRKAGHRLRSEVLRLLAPEVAGLVNASTGYALADPRFRRRAWLEQRAKAVLYRTLTPGAERWLRRRIHPPHGYMDGSGALQAVRTLLAACPAVRDYLDPRVVEAILRDAGGYRREQFSVLLTVAALVDEVTQDGRTVASLAGLTFD